MLPAVAALVLAGWLTGCTAGAAAPPGTDSAARSSASAPASGPDGSGGAAADPDGAVPPGWSPVAAARVRRVEVRAEPGGAVRTALNDPTANGSPLTFRVLDRSGAWLHVQLPVRPNGSTGWVARADVTVSLTPYRLEVHRHAHTLQVFESGRPTATYPVGIGTAVNPTPTGTYYLTELIAVRPPNGAYGPYAFGLSAFSPTLTRFAGGPGQLGLHGTDEPSLVGTDVSHGCLRVTDQVITRLAHELPLGTPVQIGP